MTDKPPETALDRLRADLARRNDPPSPAPAPESPPAPAAAPPPVSPAPASQPAGGSGQAPPIRQAPPARRQPVSVGQAYRLQQTALRRERSRTRIRVNLTWAVAVTLAAAVLAAGAYFSPTRMQDDLFSRVWPWRAHVWNKYGGAVIWCINEARKTKSPFTCRLGFLTDGPDCPVPDTQDVTAAYLCPPWEKWPTDPAPRWSAKGPPLWSR